LNCSKEGFLEERIFRILLVDDSGPWRAFEVSTLQSEADLEIISEATNGSEAVQIAEQLQPDLVLLDIGLPKINGLDAARRIREVCPRTKILFVSENRSREIAETALRIGAGGYVVKAAAAIELLPAVKAVLKGKRFVSTSLTGPALTDDVLASVETPAHHEVAFYSDDRQLLDGATHFIGTALEAGSAVIVVATESHRNDLIPRLQSRGIDIAKAIEQDRYIALNAIDALSTFMVDDMLDPARFIQSFGTVILKATKAAKGAHSRVAFFGEGAHLLWAQGNADAALLDEKLCNELIRTYEVDILCAYRVQPFAESMDDDVLQRICAEHSAVHGLG
jgi:DNA-binding NarL/FixJ family response regulator